MSLAIKQREARLEQDIAAGGSLRRKIYTANGDLVTVSLQLDKRLEGYAISLRFKSGSGHRKLVGFTKATSRSEALKEGWTLLRQSRVIEESRWRWFVD